jgi:hypothetical protein
MIQNTPLLRISCGDHSVYRQKRIFRRQNISGGDFSLCNIADCVFVIVEKIHIRFSRTYSKIAKYENAPFIFCGNLYHSSCKSPGKEYRKYLLGYRNESQ